MGENSGCGDRIKMEIEYKKIGKKIGENRKQWVWRLNKNGDRIKNEIEY
jgi:hypothetical protein